MTATQTLTASGVTTEEVKKLLIEVDGYPKAAVEAFINCFCEEDLDSFEDSYQGQWDNDEDFARSVVDSIGALPDGENNWPINCIDWKAAAEQLMYDYIEENGYYFSRNF